jgi:hypothetical protein
MTKSQAFAISTQQGHKLGKNPKGYGTKQGKKDARAKYDKPRKEYVKTPNPRELESAKMASMRDELLVRAKELEEKASVPRILGETAAGGLAGGSLGYLGARAMGADPVIGGLAAAGGAVGGALGGAGLRMRANSKRAREKASVNARLRHLNKEAEDLSGNPYLLDQVGKPKVRQRNAEAPEPKYRVKVALQQPQGVFGMPTQMGVGLGKQPGMNPAQQLAKTQNIGVPKLQQPKMKTLSMKTAGLKHAFATSQFSGTLGGGTSDIYRPSDVKYGGPASEEDLKKAKAKLAAMADELAKLNGVATTPKGKLYSTQRVGAPKTTAPPGPSISELSKPVGYGTKAPGAVKNSI